ncbi:MAG: hypothetical protein AAF845_07995 [Bacteroidota bacterium]
MSLDLSPTPEISRDVAPAALSPTVERPLPDPGATHDAFRTALPETLPAEQGRILLAAGVLDAAEQQGLSPDAASGFAARVLEAGGDGSSSLVEAGRQYRDGGGTIPADFPALDGVEGGVEIARGRGQGQPYRVNGLSRQEAADVSLIPEARQQDLADKAWNEYVLVYAHGDVYREYTGRNGQRRVAEEMPQIDFVDLKNIVTHLASRGDMTDIEKAYVWSTIADWKGVGGNWEYSNDSLHIDNRGVRPELIDSHPGRAWNTPSHSVVPFHDPVHGFGALQFESGAYGYIGYAYDSPTRAAERIREAETHIGSWVDNPGDMNASIASVRAFHAWRDAPDGQRFDAFARTWVNEVVDPAFR